MLTVHQVFKDAAENNLQLKFQVSHQKRSKNVLFQQTGHNITDVDLLKAVTKYFICFTEKSELLPQRSKSWNMPVRPKVPILIHPTDRGRH